MAREMRSIDVGNVPELARLAEEVHESNEPRVLKRYGEDLAILMPAVRRRRRTGRAKSPADYEAFRSAAGSWKDLDVERFLCDTSESRKRSNRPPAEL